MLWAVVVVEEYLAEIRGLYPVWAGGMLWRRS
jgi:hypothetical protein